MVKTKIDYSRCAKCGGLLRPISGFRKCERCEHVAESYCVYSSSRMPSLDEIDEK